MVLTGTGTAAVQTFVAPEQDVWDRWNYARTEALVDTVSARYVPPTVSGVDDLDQHGNWRVVPEYGSVWVPEGVAADWAPYTTGRWVWDPRFGWSWVDTAPWGWAPYHYGRWVHLDRVWAWAPGPVVVRPVYAPALVAFFGAPGVRVAIGAPFVSWVALGWGEPCVPWWGRPGFVGRPWWGGWGGPRVVNNVVVNRTTVVNVTNINVYRNVNVRNAVVAVRPDRFGRGPVGEARIRQVDTRQLQPVRGAVDVRPDRASFAAASGRGIRPPENVLDRGVVATRPPVTRALPREPEGRGPAPRIVAAPRPSEVGDARPPLGQSRLERARPPRAPRFESDQRPSATPPAARREDAAGPERGRRPEAQRVPDPQRTPDSPRGPEPPRGPDVPRGPELQRVPQRQSTPQVAADAAGPAGAAGPAPAGHTGRAPRARGRPAASSRRETPDQPRSAERPAAPAPSPRQAERPAAPAPQPRQVERPAAPQPRTEAPRPQQRVLPGEPANRLYPGGRVEAPDAPRARVASDGPSAPDPGARRRPGAGAGARAPLDLAGVRSGIDGPQVHRAQGGRRRVLERARRQDVNDPPAPDEQRVREQPAVAPGRLRLRAHDRGRARRRQRLQPLEPAPELVGLHVIGVAAEPRAPQPQVDRVRPRPAEAAERGEMRIADPDRLEARRERLAGELGVVPRVGQAADVGERHDLRATARGW